MQREVSFAEQALLKAYKRFNDAVIAKTDADREYAAAGQALQNELKAFPHFKRVGFPEARDVNS